MTEQHQQLGQNTLPPLALELEEPTEAEEHPNTRQHRFIQSRADPHQGGHLQRYSGAELGDAFGLPEFFTNSHERLTERMTEKRKSFKTTANDIRQMLLQTSLTSLP